MKYKVNIPEGCRVMTVEVIDDRIILQVDKENQHQEFKENDIVTTTVDDEDHVSIVKSFTNNLLKTKITTTSDLNYFINKEGTLYYDAIRISTESEKQLLFDKLKEKCLMFDGKDVVRWRCKKGDEYWFVSVTSEIKKTQDYFNGRWDDCTYGVGNYFPTRELAEAFQKQYIELLNNFHKNL